MEQKQTLKKVRAQPGPQTIFLSTPAEIAIYGGAAGGGKSYSLLLDPLRHIENKKFNSVIFRRETPQITNPGGLWQEATNLYVPLKAEPHLTGLHFTFKSGMRIKFAHLEQEKTVYDWHGSQIPHIGFDELTQFSEFQFFYMLGRNRSDSGVMGRIRATTNPHPDSWVRRLIDWWIGDDGYPIKERAGKIRFFHRDGDELIWSDKKESPFSKSFTFIPAKLEDNKILMKNDPGYEANLENMPLVDRMLLRHGNWNFRPKPGNYFKKQYFEIVDAIPADTKSCRYWDRAASEKKNADFTVGLKMHKASNGLFFISDVVRFQGSPLKVEEAVKNTASQDGHKTIIGIEQDPGQAGVAEAESYVRLLAGFDVELNKVTTNKETRAKPLSAQAERGNIKLLRGKWNEAFINELESFPDSSVKDDQVDAASGAFNMLVSNSVGDFSPKFVQNTKRDFKNVRSIDKW